MNVELSTATSGAEIRYTLDGTEPTATTGTVYSGAIEITEDTTINAIAVKDGNTSLVISVSYVKLPDIPTATPTTLEFSDAVTVDLATTTTGADIYYRLDGLDPEGIFGSTLYSSNFTLLETTTVTAIAAKDGLISGVMRVTYTKI